MLADADMVITYPNSNTITFSAGDIVGTSREFKIREVDICDSSGDAYKMQILATGLY